jgi:hypothetical protein
MAALYYAIYLTEESRKMLLAAFPPMHKNVFGEHLTVAFKPSPREELWLKSAVNDILEMTVVGVVSDDKGQAVLIKETYRLDPGEAHITISCAEGTKPVYSNILIATVKPIMLTTPLVLTGRFEPNRK